MTSALETSAQIFGLGDLGVPYGVPINGSPLVTALGEEENWYLSCVHNLTNRFHLVNDCGLWSIVGPGHVFTTVVLPEYRIVRLMVMSGRSPPMEMGRLVGAIMSADYLWYDKIYTELAEAGYSPDPVVWSWIREMGREIERFLSTQDKTYKPNP